MSATALRLATDAVQAAWASRTTTLAVRGAELVLADYDTPAAAITALRALLAAQTKVVADQGAAALATILSRSGVVPGGEAPATVQAVPIALARTVARIYETAERHPAPATARRAGLQRVIDTALTDAWTDGLLAAMDADPRVIGWRRVARPGCCGACLALATPDVHPPDERLARHPRCKCIPEPVVVGVNEQGGGRPTPAERFAAMTAAEQDQMFAGHGGQAKADLLRAGAVEVSDLATYAPRRPGQQPVVFETPAAALTAA